jgi:hypothetical protein
VKRYALILLLAGCAQPMTWYKEGGSQAEYEQDVARCTYEAHAATASYSQGQTARTNSGAVAQGIGEGMTMSMRQRDLAILCMRARGYYTK